jgi:two-component sensor histidine kinase
MPAELIKTTIASPPLAGGDTMAEANHRIANNLAMVAGLVRMYGRRIEGTDEPLDNEAIRILLEEIGSRIETVGRLHGLLARTHDAKWIDVGGYLRDLSEAVVSSLTFAAKARLSYTTRGTCLMAPERALPLGFVVVELITNAVKYAHPAGLAGEIGVSCHSGNGGITVDVSDDGVGLPEGFDPTINGGLGFRLMRSLADQVGATITFNDTGTGLSVRVQAPQE